MNVQLLLPKTSKTCVSECPSELAANEFEFSQPVGGNQISLAGRISLVDSEGLVEEIPFAMKSRAMQ